MNCRKMPKNPTGNYYKERRSTCGLTLQSWMWYVQTEKPKLHSKSPQIQGFQTTGLLFHHVHGSGIWVSLDGSFVQVSQAWNQGGQQAISPSQSRGPLRPSHARICPLTAWQRTPSTPVEQYFQLDGWPGPSFIGSPDWARPTQDNLPLSSKSPMIGPQ